MYIALDQYGNHFSIKKHPRKELLEHFGRQHADKLYHDNLLTGETEHIGYVIDGHWLSVFRLSSAFKNERNENGNSTR